MVGIVILNYNNCSDIFKCIDSVVEYTPLQEIKIVVVDNGSTDSVRQNVGDYLSHKFSPSYEEICASSTSYINKSLKTMTYLCLEHNLGYAMDIVCVEEWFETTDEYKWLTENAADYGFILRYPKHKQDITKVTYEPWHWRYVGVEAAKEMKATDQVLEEYLGAQ